MGVLERFSNTQVIEPHHENFVDPAAAGEAFDKILVEREHFRDRARDIIFDGFLADLVHDRGNIDIVGAADGAGIAAGAEPGCFFVQHPLFLAQGQEVDNLVWKQVHIFGHGAAAAAFAALVTEMWVFLKHTSYRGNRGYSAFFSLFRRRFVVISVGFLKPYFNLNQG